MVDGLEDDEWEREYLALHCDGMSDSEETLLVENEDAAKEKNEKLQKEESAAAVPPQT